MLRLLKYIYSCLLILIIASSYADEGFYIFENLLDKK